MDKHLLFELVMAHAPSETKNQVLAMKNLEDEEQRLRQKRRDIAHNLRESLLRQTFPQFERNGHAVAIPS